MFNLSREEPLEKFACDVVLLPSEKVMEAAIRINRRLIRSFEPKIVLNRTDCLPHLSLAMGALHQKDLSTAAGLLESVALQFPPVPLIFTEIHAGIIGTGETVSTLRTERTPSLQALHEAVMDRIGPLLSQNAAAEAFIGFPEVSPTSVDWVNRYRDEAAFDRFSPHLTLGVGRLEAEVPIPSGAGLRLALCHLGNYCTCRKIRFETPLRS